MNDEQYLTHCLEALGQFAGEKLDLRASRSKLLKLQRKPQEKIIWGT